MKAIILIFFAVLCTTIGFAQKNSNANFLNAAQKPYYVGITLAYNQADFRIVQSVRFLQHDSIIGVRSSVGSGFNLGIINNLSVGKNVDFRLSPTLSFVERRLNYEMTDHRIVQRKIESVFVEMPFDIRYKSAPYHDIRIFVIAGMKYGFDVAANSRARQAEKLIKIAPSDFSAQYGVGFQVFLPYFTLSPEFKVSQGLSNTIIFDNNLQQSSVIEQLYSRAFTFSLHFEG